MKNIYICGIPRSGKTTLSKMIKESFPDYNMLSFEAIRNAFIKVYPNLDMGNRKSNARINDLPIFITELVKWNKIVTEKPTLIEGDFTTVDILDKLKDEDSKIIVLGLGCRNIDDILAGIRSHDTASDYTNELDDNKIKTHFHDSEEKDKLNYNYCKDNNINYYDTYNNRKLVFESVLKDIKDN